MYTSSTAGKKHQPLFCLVYWIHDKQTSIENIRNVKKKYRQLNTESKIIYGSDGKRYWGKILKIGNNERELSAQEDNLCERELNCPIRHRTQPMRIINSESSSSGVVERARNKKVQKKSKTEGQPSVKNSILKMNNLKQSYLDILKKKQQQLNSLDCEHPSTSSVNRYPTTSSDPHLEQFRTAVMASKKTRPRVRLSSSSSEEDELARKETQPSMGQGMAVSEMVSTVDNDTVIMSLPPLENADCNYVDQDVTAVNEMPAVLVSVLNADEDGEMSEERLENNIETDEPKTLEEAKVIIKKLKKKLNYLREENEKLKPTPAAVDYFKRVMGMPSTNAVPSVVINNNQPSQHSFSGRKEKVPVIDGSTLMISKSEKAQLVAARQTKNPSTVINKILDILIGRPELAGMSALGSRLYKAIPRDVMDIIQRMTVKYGVTENYLHSIINSKCGRCRFKERSLNAFSPPKPEALKYRPHNVRKGKKAQPTKRNNFLNSSDEEQDNSM